MVRGASAPDDAPGHGWRSTRAHTVAGARTELGMRTGATMPGHGGNPGAASVKKRNSREDSMSKSSNTGAIPKAKVLEDCAGGAHWLAPRPGTPRPQAVLPHRIAQRPSPIMVPGGGSGTAFAAGFNVVSLV